MKEKKYYRERKGLGNHYEIDLDFLKSQFLTIYLRFKQKFFFMEALGYDCTEDFERIGKWGVDPKKYVEWKLKTPDIWPIEENIHEYDEDTLFSMIEFSYDYVSEPTDIQYHSWNQCGYHADNFDKDSGQAKFRKEINSLLKIYKNGFKLNKDSKITKLPPRGLKSLVANKIKTKDPKNIDNRIHRAINEYLRYNSSFDDKREAIRSLGDVFEFLKKRGQIDNLPSKANSDLFQIMNRFGFRHHNIDQKTDYEKKIWYDWIFYTLLTTVYTHIKINEL